MSSAMLAKEVVAPAETSRQRGSAGATDFGEKAGRLGVEIADIAGIVEDLTGLNGELLNRLERVVVSVEDSSETNRTICEALQEARATASTTRQVLSQSAEQVSDTLTCAIDNMEALGEGVVGVLQSLEKVQKTVAKVQEASAAIQSISMETQIIAINAGVEAARAGEAGRGFGVIAQAIKSLADEVRKFSDANGRQLVVLQELLDQMLAVARGSSEKARSATEASHSAKGANKQIQSLVSSVQVLTTRIEAMAKPAQSNAESAQRVRESVEELVSIVETADSQLATTRKRSANIVGISEDLMLFIAEAGFETRDSALIALCQATAGEVAKVFEAALQAGELSSSDLFDENYRPIPGTNPQQVTTRFTGFTDRNLPVIQERVLGSSDRIAFCAAVDRNGYLPTHNLIYSKPQGSDPVWNAANSRNRRIFGDRTGLSAGRNTRTFLLQTYRRDMGGGKFALMKDISAPIIVQGRHWGGFRMGVKV